MTHNERIEKSLNLNKYSKELIDTILTLRNNEQKKWKEISKTVNVCEQNVRALYRIYFGESKGFKGYCNDDIKKIIALKEKGYRYQEIKDELKLNLSESQIGKIYNENCCKSIEKRRNFKLPIMKSDIHEAMRIACEISGVRDNFYQLKQG